MFPWPGPRNSRRLLAPSLTLCSYNSAGECLFYKEKVGGSNPSGSTMKIVDKVPRPPKVTKELLDKVQEEAEDWTKDYLEKTRVMLVRT